MKRKKVRLKRSIIKNFLILIIFSFILSFLFSATYYIYMNARKIDKYNKKTEEYSYLEIEKMSDKFAEIENRELHFARDKYGALYIIAINSKEIDKYKAMIEYTYGRGEKTKPIKLYGLPVKVNKELKELVMSNINKFLSSKEQININDKNYEEYFPSTFLDTTIKENYKFNYVVFLLFLICFLIFLMLIKILFFKKLE